MPDLGFCGRSLWSLGCNLCRWLMLWPAQHRQLLCGRVPVFYTPAKRQKQIKYWHFFSLLSLCCGRVFFRCKHIFPHPLTSPYDSFRNLQEFADICESLHCWYDCYFLYWGNYYFFSSPLWLILFTYSQQPPATARNLVGEYRFFPPKWLNVARVWWTGL